MFTLRIKIVFFGLLAFILGNCAATQVEHTEPKPFQEFLVGVTPNYPPIIFKQGGEFAGVDADLARMLALELGKPVKFVELRWDKQIPALLAREIDIIMSGMTITKARGIRVNFSDHYRVVSGTTSDVFVRKNFPNLLNVVALQEADDAPAALDRRSIDIFIHDAPSIMWLISENEADLSALRVPLNEEKLAWGVRRDDEKLLMKVNSILSKWKKDGTLNRILLRWLPSRYLEIFK
jgi:polar amino acid transport system substrate-binding protein